MTHGEALRTALMTISGMGHRAWARQVGIFLDLRGKHRRIGVKGEPDISGTLRGGYSLYVEIKTGAATRTTEQRAFGEMIHRLGACYVVARYSDTDDGDAAIKAAIETFLEKRKGTVYTASEKQPAQCANTGPAEKRDRHAAA